MELDDTINEVGEAIKEIDRLYGIYCIERSPDGWSTASSSGPIPLCADGWKTEFADCAPKLQPPKSRN